MSSTRTLASELRGFAVRSVETLLRDFLPGGSWPRIFAGHVTAPNDVADLAYVLAHLHRTGVETVAGSRVEDLARAALLQVDGPSCSTFYSYRVAETLLAFPGLLGSLPPDQRDNLVAATDSTSLYDPASDTLRAPNNYWAVLARCELGRHRLGFTSDTALLDLAVGRTCSILSANPSAYLDDSPQQVGRFDLYTADFLLFLEPLHDRLGADLLHRCVATHARLLHDLAHPSGALMVYGRSIGALSVCATLELSALLLARFPAFDPDPARTLALARHAAGRLTTDWFGPDALTSAHRHRSPYKYRDLPRLLQMTLDVLGKLLYAAEHLSHARDVPEFEAGGGELFPPADTFIPFDANSACVWSYRRKPWAFQLPAVSGYDADYVAAPKQPGVLGAPSDTDVLTFTPRLLLNNIEYTSAHRPVASAHTPGSLTLTYDAFTPARKTPQSVPLLRGTRRVTFAVNGVHLDVTERWTFSADQIPQHAHLDIAESGRPLTVNVTSGPRVSQSALSTEGFHAFRDYFGEFRKLHQLRIPTAPEVAFAYRVTPAVHVLNIPGPHDYNRALFDAFPKGTVLELPHNQGVAPEDATLDKLLAGRDDVDVLHLGWPEHFIARPEGMSEAEHDALHDRFLADLRRAGIKLIWTQHNRRPHNKSLWPDARADHLYRRWAAASHGVIHHSRVGMATMLPDLPWNPSAEHVVIPHGHFGAAMHTPLSIAQLEAKHALPALSGGGVRFGILGRYQPEKQIELLIECFLAAARPDDQLVITAYTEALWKQCEKRDPRLFLLPRPGWLTRALIAEHTTLCDVLLSAHSGERYLTSGIQADAQATGATMLVPDWPFFRETLGDTVFYHDNTRPGIEHLLRTLTRPDYDAARARMRAAAPAFDWSLLSRHTLELYHRVLRT